MRFSELLADLSLRGLSPRRLTPPELDPEITGITQDSREVPRGSLFVAISGMRTDAHDFIPQVAAAGAGSIFLEREVDVPAGVAAAVFPDGRLALAFAAAGLQGHPSEEMTIVGITGTDGKSTTSVMTVEALLACGVAAGGMNSLDFRVLDRIEPNDSYMTTLESPVIQRHLRELADAGVRTSVLETTSHGLALHRVDAIAFDIAAYTNLTHEHLDFHGTLEAYRDAKLQLAELARQSPRKAGVPKAIVYNADEPAWSSLGAAPTDRRVTYGMQRSADVAGVDVEARIDGIGFTARTSDGDIAVTLPLTGRFNVYNALCALAICRALGLPLDRAAEGLARTRGLRGRMQVLDAGQQFAIVIDFAHTPDGLEKVLSELRPLTSGRLLTVFGAPGDRDATKRPLMGEAVGKLSDEFVITTDDPRHESVEAISEEIAAGAERAGRRRGEDFRMIVDRREAIRDTLSRARPGDTVLLAGKGHEDRMLVGGQTLPWDEAAEARVALAELGVRG
ncbi:MAG: UDP-N-acetylmuramoyl-L-alanyl-D-glutamate--2,6-diaminopimelate ligase [Chloroflexota bacterium]|jgi:UDP-N-acetylmuramoyl-L-alanyl-D-glutamate--2,6-diaminopimelate ligase|nr:UDP-N-acetylmuramoyl-L-alanyl-D-glutamate--2,6-diaminopimelate ligase [Chloroflexota bacterium]